MSHAPEAPWPPRPRLTGDFFKAHGLGNDYLVFEEASDDAGGTWAASADAVRRVCDPHTGIGADGIVVLLRDPSPPGPERRVRLRMFNPDGGEFERSGNGLRVLAARLAVVDPEASVIQADVGGGRVRMEVHGREGPVVDVSVDMGRARTGPEAIAMAPDVLTGEGPAFAMPGPGGEPLTVVPVSVGNPHLVVLAPEGAPFGTDRLADFGLALATHPAIRDGTNVQLARVRDGRIEARIWERGVGPTTASGTSACAVAVAMVRTGGVAPGGHPVHMPGGTLNVTVGEDLGVVLRGPVEVLFEGRLFEELLATFEPGP